ncbi:hypothetical protein KIH74_22640 [Kineosporia sp. J2-2]|uniref:Uncharacterized protein n=1 Tax=Kineosporia corallincola TaxID=2835133 RepID=A0ABS5TKZ8_9ACTN|nr:hypothetical protein [Kineosporia corallincola]MBT0771756.1 hypothetical protein [Kineosporia corallincola]
MGTKYRIVWRSEKSSAVAREREAVRGYLAGIREAWKAGQLVDPEIEIWVSYGFGWDLLEKINLRDGFVMVRQEAA